MLYNLELDRLIARIKETQCKTILLQLPDGLKPEAKTIVDTIRKQTGAEALIWLGSCYGACDVPQGLSSVGIDLFVAWGHNVFRRKEGWE
ncbi:diphthamide synthesis protein [Candidatus Woesearchaeota archaeon]|nr:diphthamide synthesis protein [Candidatus Woesearchaeota archaeon]